MTTLHAWLPGTLDLMMERAVGRLRREVHVDHVALMPDAHLAADVCVGTVVASATHLYPDAVGGDVGCGMRAIRFEMEADRLQSPREAARVLSGLIEGVPILKRLDPLEHGFDMSEIGWLEGRARREGRWQLGTLGRGNHFVELQRDDLGWLWAMIHTGSRGVGPAIRARHHRDGELVSLEADSNEGALYLRQVGFARAWARASRARIEDVVAEVLGAARDETSRIDIDHNHVERETHRGRSFWVHRKGAARAREGELAVVPGSMGSASYHVEGRGHPDALTSCSHGAGRAFSRTEAKRRIGRNRLMREMRGVFFDHRNANALREEAPSAYKDVGAVMRAQRDLVRVVRRLRPLLVHKG